jgi:long-chain acyl-CoA synthetase
MTPRMSTLGQIQVPRAAAALLLTAATFAPRAAAAPLPSTASWTFSPAPAVPNDTFADEVDQGDRKLTKRGQAVYRYGGLVKVMTGALYLPADVESSKALTAVPRRLIIEYHFSVKGKQFGATADSHFQKHQPASALATHRDRISKLHNLYPDIAAGDRLELDFKPGTGIELFHNGRSLGTVEGDDFAGFYFGLWLGDKPIDAGMRRKLLNVRR